MRPADDPHRLHGFAGERVLMRIHIGESDRWEGDALYVAIVQLLRKRHFAGATVFRGVLGFGAHATLHESHLFRISSDLPIVVECVETEENIAGILPEIDRMLDGGLNTIETVRVILYRPGLAPDAREAGWTTDLPGNGPKSA